MKLRISVWSLILSLVLSIFSTPGAVVAEDGGNSGSYVKTFLISAYYSPLPCQEKYTTGSFEGDKRLNGNGTHGADGTPVYPGMVAAPKSYEFGTKLHIPGIGNVAVHDRGGAIVESNGEEGRYDRLDIWMGYGDIGLKRALQWGKRTVDVVVYGVDGKIVEEVNLLGFSEAESIPNECQESVVLASSNEVIEDFGFNDVPESTPEVVEEVVKEPVVSDSYFNTGLEVGSEGAEVVRLQEELASLNFYWGEVNGNYDELTEHAVFKFQQSQGVIGSKEDLGAGNFGPQTRDRMNEILASRAYTGQLIAEATAEYGQAVVLAGVNDEATAGTVF